jgi:hypothetical protein
MLSAVMDDVMGDGMGPLRGKRYSRAGQSMS